MTEISNELVIKAAAGDMTAFEEIYKATSTFVYNVTLRVTNNTSDADEVTQEVFIKVYNNLRDFGFRSSFKTWVYRVAVNAAINYCKKHARRRQSDVEYDPAVHDVAASGTTAAAHDAEDAEKRVAGLLGALEPDQRACIVLREIEELDYRAIADTLHININTVRSRLKRGREKLISIARKG